MTHRIALFTIGLLFISLHSHAADSAQVTIKFNQPHQFTDFVKANGGRGDGRPALMAELERFTKERGELWLPAGYRLDIEFHDIDMAGRIVPLPLRRNTAGGELGAFGSAAEQRVVESPWPPRLIFDYRLHNHQGDIIQQGSADLVETSFLRLSPRTRLLRRDGLWYEKAVLDSWMRALTE